MPLHPPGTMLENLGAIGPEVAHADDLQLFGRLIGSWDLDMWSLDPDGARRSFSGEWHFGWVLEGRAVQDVLVTRSSDGKIVGYGSTIRSLDTRTGRWWIVWQDPLAGEFSVLLAEPEENRIVLRGQWTLAAGAKAFRWTFSDITAGAFLWECHLSENGTDWRLAETIQARRSSPES